MKTWSVASFLLKSIMCLFLAIFAISANAGYKHKHHSHHKHAMAHQQMAGNCCIIWARGHYVPFDGYCPGKYIRLQ